MIFLQFQFFTNVVKLLKANPYQLIKVFHDALRYLHV